MNDSPKRSVTPDGTVPAIVRGAALIGLAVVIGVILLAQVDDTTGSAAPAGKPTRTTTTTTATSTTTAPVGPARAPADLKIIVLNAGGPNGAAGALSETLRGEGYTDQLPANTWSGRVVTGTQVMCRTGLEREATSLAVVIGTARVVDFPTPAPPNTAQADCVVVVGTSDSNSTTAG